MLCRFAGGLIRVIAGSRIDGKKQEEADDYEDIGKVEHWPSSDIDQIDDRAVDRSVDEVRNCTADEQTRRHATKHASPYQGCHIDGDA